MYPNLADRVRLTPPQRLEIDNLDLGVEPCFSATDERARMVLLGHSFDHAMLFECVSAESASGGAAAAAYFQRRFRQSVSRIERFLTKAAVAKRIGKVPQRLHAHRLRAVISHTPTA